MTLHYRNNTGDDLDLLLYSCDGHYRSQKNPSDSPKPTNGRIELRPERLWYRIPFKAGADSYYEKFPNGTTGWFLCFVQDRGGASYPLGRWDIFQSQNPRLVVEKNQGKYTATFSSEK